MKKLKTFDQHLREGADDLVGEAAINEATFVTGKALMQLKDVEEIVSYMQENIRQSPDYDESKDKSDACIRDIRTAFLKFKMEVMDAVKPLALNHAGT